MCLWNLSWGVASSWSRAEVTYASTATHPQQEIRGKAVRQWVMRLTCFYGVWAGVSSISDTECLRFEAVTNQQLLSYGPDQIPQETLNEIPASLKWCFRQPGHSTTEAAPSTPTSEETELFNCLAGPASESTQVEANELDLCWVPWRKRRITWVGGKLFCISSATITLICHVGNCK